VIAHAGYMFPMTEYEKNKFPLKIYHGTTDKTRPFEFIKISYERKNAVDDIELIEGMDHEYKSPALR
jgi:hypothetical protein